MARALTFTMGLFAITPLFVEAQASPFNACESLETLKGTVCVEVDEHAASDTVTFLYKSNNASKFTTTRTLALQWETYCGMTIAEEETYLAICTAAEGHPEFTFYPLDYLMHGRDIEPLGNFFDYYFVRLKHLSADAKMTYEAEYSEAPPHAHCETEQIGDVTEVLSFRLSPQTTLND
ncbi:hypothetical protein QTP81_04225 [Alteromonas sp. ASW11-36]|uniref:DUF4377 domain-containing protein n=1 Tax=Alteromonas arenosi TaxID=3055817 RepID=A0ABT7SUE7_9ALTE|nr:hypothetical protein [Alteromonas sp. ASW11-36]MDM7859806.1 hypothetical protein [Alteromonas sp. ASW11-36]